MFSALRAVAAYYFRADKQGICNTLEKCACGPETLAHTAEQVSVWGVAVDDISQRHLQVAV
jgi:hypothetical protein